MRGTKYALVFVVCVVLGVVVVFVGPAGVISGGQLVHFGMKGLLVEQQIEKDAIEFDRQVYLRELDEKYRQAEHERQMQILRLQRPALPDEGY